MTKRTPAVLVAGGAGYIGSHACKALAAAGYLPVAYDNLDFGHRAAVQWGPLVEGDIADADRVRRAVADHEVVAAMHFAAYTYVGESVSDPRKYFRNNLINAIRFVDGLLDAGVRRLVFSSTCATYGMPQAVPIGEDHPQQPVNPYGETKLMVERVLHWYGAAYGLRWMALRYFNAAGADPLGRIGEDHRPETHLIPLVLEAALGQRPHIDVFGTDYPTPDGTAIRDYIHVDDLADAHVRALRHLEHDGASLALNLGTGNGYSVREVIATAEKVAGRPVPVRESARRPGDPPRLVADARQARAVLGWQPRHDRLETIVASAWAWHARHLANVATGGVAAE